MTWSWIPNKAGKPAQPESYYIVEELKLTREIGSELLSTSAEVKEAFVAYMTSAVEKQESKAAT